MSPARSARPRARRKAPPAVATSSPAPTIAAAGIDSGNGSMRTNPNEKTIPADTNNPAGARHQARILEKRGSPVARENAIASASESQGKAGST